MAIKTKKANAKFVSDMAGDVAQMLNGFRSARSAMGKSTKAERKRFTSNLKTEVAGMRQVVADDVAGARMAWNGLSPAARKAKEEAERRAKRQAELTGKG